MRCSYRGCGKSRRTCPGLKVYSFPVKDKERCKQWIINSGNSLDIALKKSEVLCEDHFIKEDFVNETKHRLIQMAIPKHYTDLLGHARRRERGLDTEENKAISVDGNTKVLSLCEKLQKDLQKMQMEESNSRPIILSNSDIGEKEQNENDTTEQRFIHLRHELLKQKQNCKLHLVTNWNRKIKCIVRKSVKKDVTTNKFQWLEEILKKRALNENKNITHYITINDLLASFEITEPPESFDFTDLEFGWHNRKEKAKVKCYSRKNNGGTSSNHFSPQSNCSEDTKSCQRVKVEDACFQIKLEEVEDCKNIPDMLLSSEYEFTNQDVKDEEISECQLHWSEEDDKGCIRTVDISKLQTERCKEESGIVSTGRMFKKRRKSKQRFASGRNNAIWTTETQRFNYIINRNRLQIHNLKSKLRKCHKELKRLRKSKREIRSQLN